VIKIETSRGPDFLFLCRENALISCFCAVGNGKFTAFVPSDLKSFLFLCRENALISCFCAVALISLLFWGHAHRSEFTDNRG
jgi:hypothetical protein